MWTDFTSARGRPPIMKKILTELNHEDQGDEEGRDLAFDRHAYELGDGLDNQFGGFKRDGGEHTLSVFSHPVLDLLRP